MEELMESQEKAGFFSRFTNIFTKDREEEMYEEEDVAPTSAPRLHLRPATRYHITVRRQVTSFQDAVAAADGLKRGEQQILNLTSADAAAREKIKDFMAGVNYAQEGYWEELGDNVYLLAPNHACVECAPATPRMQAARN